VPYPGNPEFIDISVSQPVGWTASVHAEDDPSAPLPSYDRIWSCTTQSGQDCPLVDTSQPDIVFDSSTFAVDTYTITLTVVLADSVNYTPEVTEETLTFQTTDLGG
jgi:hypothetical protein